MLSSTCNNDQYVQKRILCKLSWMQNKEKEENQVHDFRGPG